MNEKTTYIFSETRVNQGGVMRCCWNHRVMRHVSPLISEPGEVEISFAIHEVYYDDNDKPDGWTVDHAGVVGDDIGELRETLERMLACLEKPILEYGDEND